MMAMFVAQAVASTVPLQAVLPLELRGRYLCSLTTRRQAPSQVELVFGRAGASIAADEGAGIASVTEATVRVDTEASAGTMQSRRLQFRTPGAGIDVVKYNRRGMPGHLHMTVTQDAGPERGLPEITASGFCVGLLPMVSPRK